ncbi:hypothetical protein ACOMHN_056254 [Nucella lapillus]
MAESAGTHVNIFKNLEDNLKLVIQQIRDGESSKVDNQKFKFNSDKYWEHLGAIFKALSVEGTKFSLAFTQPPFPNAKESEGMVKSMEKAFLELVSTFYSLPKTQGITLRKNLQRAVVDVAESLLDLVSSLAQLDPEAGERRQATGVVWEGVKGFPTLPKNNCQAVALTLEQSASLVSDALEEIDEIESSDGQCDDFFRLEEDEDEEETDNTKCWTEQEKEMVGPVKGLVKTATKLLSKAREANRVKGKCDADEQVAQLDDLSDCAERLSPAVDNLTSCLYAPVDHTAVRDNATALSDVISNLLSILRHSHVTGEGDQKWLDFLHKANTHNLTSLLHLLDK